MSHKTKISDADRGTYFIWDGAPAGSGYISGYVWNERGYSGKRRLYQTRATQRGTYVTVQGKRVYIRG